MKKLLAYVLIILINTCLCTQKSGEVDSTEYIDLYVTFYWGIIPSERVEIYIIDPYGEEKKVPPDRLIGRITYTDYSDFKYQIEKDYISYIRIVFPDRGVSVIQGLKYSRQIYLEVSISLKNEIRISTSDSPFVRE